MHGSQTRVVLTLIALTLVGAAQPVAVRASNPSYYSLKLDDKLIGYAIVKSVERTENGRRVREIDGLTSLKVALLGKERVVKIKSVTRLDANSGAPIDYRQTTDTNGTVQHVDAQWKGTAMQLWSYGKGEPRGEPKTLDVPKGSQPLGGNNFAHWELLGARLAKTSEKTVTVPMVLPEAAQIQSFVLTRGETKEVEAAGVKRGLFWSMAGSDLQLVVDAKDGEFLQLRLPSQRTVVARTDVGIVKQAEKSQAEELLARHFAHVDVQFDDSLKVNYLKAELDVNLLGGKTGLNTPMQKFTGSSEGNGIQGTFVLRSRPYDPKQHTVPTFPASVNADDNSLAAYLQPSTYIESDNEKITAQAASLTKDAADRWDAVLRIGRWVHQEIRYTIADTPSAKLALEKRAGDCGPHSTLTVAMLRSVGIPARLVGGLVYTPSFGGSFGQHAWVEVKMGSAGWLPIDPTTGEFEHFSATHIRLFEGVGGVLPASVKVLAFEPPNRKIAAVASKPKPLTWKVDQPYRFDYKQAGKPLGSETFTLSRIKHDGQEAWQLKDDLKLTVGPTEIRAKAKMVVSASARPHSYQRDFDTAGQKVSIQCAFADALVKVEITGSTELSREIKLQPGDFCFDNNMMSTFVVICSQLDYEVGKTINLRTFHPTTLQVIPLAFKVEAIEEIEVAGKQEQCYRCQVAPIKNTFWITRDRRFIKASQGTTVIELAK